MSTTERTPGGRGWIGRRVVGADGAGLGTLEQVHAGRGSREPSWGTVDDGGQRHVVPLQGAEPGDGDGSSGSVRVAANAQQVRTAPTAPAGQELGPDTEAELSRHYSTDSGSRAPGDRAEPERRRGKAAAAVSMRRSRGLVSGLVLIPLGIWAGIIPFVGPYFGYGFAPDQTWLFTLDRLWLSILPAIAILLGGLMLAPAANRITGSLGGWLALAGGIWFVIGPAISEFWGNTGPAAPIGQPFGGNALQAVEHLGMFYGPGALATMLAAFALGRMAVRSVRDPAARRSEWEHRPRRAA